MSQGIGSLIGAFILAGIGEVKCKGLVFFVLLTVAIGANIVFSWVRILPLALVVLAIQGAAQMTGFSINNATLQMRVPDDKLGRVLSVNTLNIAFIPMGGLFGGVLAQAFGGPIALTIIGTAGLIFVVGAILLLPGVRDL